mmetsp:Transcript_24602/g.36120  ORF Transcript_24602/g.36120 Transcript_24602/m.36120 type:complete len:119 (-) Transcript_24602:533-889(-)
MMDSTTSNIVWLSPPTLMLHYSKQYILNPILSHFHPAHGSISSEMPVGFAIGMENMEWKSCPHRTNCKVVTVALLLSCLFLELEQHSAGCCPSFPRLSVCLAVINPIPSQFQAAHGII